MHRKLISASVALVAGALLAVGLATRDVAASKSPRATIAAQGERVAIPARLRPMFESNGYDGLQLLGIVGDHAYYSVPSDEGVCYAVGFASSIGTPGAIKCWGSVHPIMDFTLVEATRDDPELRVYQSEGLAADGIDTVELADAAGTVIASTKVKHNIFQFKNVRKGAKQLVARGQDGRRVTTDALP
jgi:hypothetical protein